MALHAHGIGCNATAQRKGNAYCLRIRIAVAGDRAHFSGKRLRRSRRLRGFGWLRGFGRLGGRGQGRFRRRRGFRRWLSRRLDHVVRRRFIHLRRFRRSRGNYRRFRRSSGDFRRLRRGRCGRDLLLLAQCDRRRRSLHLCGAFHRGLFHLRHGIRCKHIHDFRSMRHKQNHDGQ